MATSSPPLSETNPELLVFWDYERNHTEGWSPNKIQAGSGKHAHWKHWHETVLPYGEEWAGWHEWTRSVQNQKKYKSCPICEGQTILKGFNDIFTRFPHLEEEWDVELNYEAGIDPYIIKPGNKAHHAHWKHWHETTLLNGKKWAGWHKWEMSPNSRTHGTKPQSCPICGKTKLLKGYNDFATTHPHLLKEWDYKNNPDVQPEEIFAGTHNYVSWQCAEGHMWEAKAYARAYIGSGCPKCRRAPVPAKTKLNTISVSIPQRTELTATEDIGYTEIADYLRLEMSELILTGVADVVSGELDVYIPSKNLAIELNGLYWHSEAMGKDRNYHYNKYKTCKDKGIQLIQIWEDDWRENKTFIKQALVHKLQESTQLSIGARKLKPINLDYAESATFLKANHIQGPATGTKYYGLTSPETGLRAVLTVKRSGNTGHEGEWLIERYATAGPTPGGFTKLLKHAEKEIKAAGENITTWVTFSDNCISDGGLYANNGFTLDKELKPDYTYLKNGSRIHKFNYRLKRFREDPTLLWDETLSEKELAKLNSIHRIWDAGKIRWVRDVGVVCQEK